MRPSRLSLAVILALVVACSGSGGQRPIPGPVGEGTPGVKPTSTPTAVGTPPVAPLPSPLALDTVTELDRRVRTGKLPNGLTYYVLPHKQAAYDAKYSTKIRGGESFFRSCSTVESDPPRRNFITK